MVKADQFAWRGTGRTVKRNTERDEEGFTGGSVVKNLPASAGDVGLIPGPGRRHMLWSN